MILDRILAKRIVPVVVLDSVYDAEPLAEAILQAGLDIMEVTFRTPAAADSIQRIAEKFPEILVGAGTLLFAEQVKRARDSGAEFGLAPSLNPATIEAAHSCGLTFSPGVMTPSEIEQALSLDCSVLKFFPAGAAGGVKMLKSLAGPYAHTGVRFIPTGGVSSSNLNDYLALPVVAAVGGSWMVDPKLIRSGSWSEITDLTRQALETASTKPE